MKLLLFVLFFLTLFSVEIMFSHAAARHGNTTTLPEIRVA
jgi:hypothetical protein